MIDKILLGLRETRHALIAGFSLVLTAWLVVADDLPDEPTSDSVARRFADGLEHIGAAGRLAVLGLVAYFLGSVIFNSFDGRLSLLPLTRSWDSRTKTLEKEIDFHEAETTSKLSTVRELQRANTDLAELLANRAECELRFWSAAWLTLPALAAAFIGAGLYWLTLGAPAVLLLDGYLIGRNIGIYSHRPAQAPDG